MELHSTIINIFYTFNISSYIGCPILNGTSTPNSKEVIFKENDPDKNCCTQKETSNGNLEIVLNDLSQSD